MFSVGLFQMGEENLANGTKEAQGRERCGETGVGCRRENEVIKFQDLQKMWGWTKGWSTKKNEDGEDLGGYLLDDGDNESQHTAN